MSSLCTLSSIFIQKIKNISHQAKTCMIRAGTTRTVYAFSITVHPVYPVESPPSMFFATEPGKITMISVINDQIMIKRVPL